MKKDKKTTQKINIIKIIIAVLVVVVSIIILINLILKKDTKTSSSEIIEVDLDEHLLKKIDRETTAQISKYIVYGNHFNLEGTIDVNNFSEDDTSNIEIVLIDLENNETKLETQYSVENNTISFSTGDIINQGLNLENLDKAYYFVFLKIENNNIKYYTLNNATEYENLEYYTITKNNSNNKIDISFSEYKTIPYLNIKTKKVSKLPNDVYDIVIDAGHGGLDVGATSGNYNESDIVLSCAKTLKTKLEDLGFKVFLTRDGTEPEDENTAYNMYDDDGRITLAMESNAKILISLHLNSNSEELSTGGVEVYAPCKSDLTLAKLLADNIVSIAKTNYSRMESYKEYNGVYVHNFSRSEITSFRDNALNGGYEAYNITTTTPYLYIIRETGGIATNAFVDGRNKRYSSNKYYNTNVGIESYLIELGYIIVDEDLENILNNEDSYMEAIAKSLEEFYL